ncbi:MAG: glycoside hydrolase [Prevotella sp.]|nr:glycoside hydrolase [Prevotella sp.]
MMEFKKLMMLLLLIVLGGVTSVNAQSTVSIGDQITSESDLVSGTAYLVYYVGNGNPGFMKDTGSAYTGKSDDTATKAAMYVFTSNGDGTWTVQNSYTKNYWGTPTAAANTYIGSSTAGNWALNFLDGGNIAPSCNGYSWNRSGSNIHPHNLGTANVNQLRIYEVGEEITAITPTASEIYTLNNTNTSRGALTYDPTNSTVWAWSSGKSGATAFDATSANCQWIFYPTGTDGQYYLYNVGAQKFIVPVTGGSYSGYSWALTDDAVAVTLTVQSDGTYMVKTASGDIYASVSNNYIGPIINYNDVGAQFTVTKVADVTTEITTQLNAAVNKLIYNITPLSEVVSSDGWYVVQIKSKSGSEGYTGRYVYTNTSLYNDLYPLAFTGNVDVQPAISNATYYTYLDKTNGYWQMPNGKYLVLNSSNKFPTQATTAATVTFGYNEGSYFKSDSYYADPYNSGSNYFIGETTSYRTTYNVYPISLIDAGLAAWKVVITNGTDETQLACTRDDVSGLTAVYNNGYFFLPTDVTPESSDFEMDGMISCTIDSDNNTITANYDPTIGIVAEGVAVTQGYQTTGQGNTDALLLRMDVTALQDVTNAALTVTLDETTQQNISSLYVYETTETEFIANIPSTKLGTADAVSASTTISIGAVSEGTHYYWLCATINNDATLGDILDAALTTISYTTTEVKTLDVTSVGNPEKQGMKVFAMQTFLAKPTQDDCRFWRIPALMKDQNGDLVAAVDMRYNSNADLGGHKIDVVSYRSTDSGKTWGNKATVAAGDGNSASAYGFGDAAITRAANGNLICVMAAGNKRWSADTSSGMMYAGVATSTDNGASWTLVPNIFTTSNFYDEVHSTQGSIGFANIFTTSGKGLVTNDGIIMYTTNCLESGTSSPALNYILYSVDNGVNWRLSNALAYSGTDESKLEQLSDGSLLLSVRQSGNRGWNKATYTNNGDGTVTFTWGTQYRSADIWGNACNADIINYGREMSLGEDVLIHSYINTSGRQSLQLSMSIDGGNSWTDVYNIQPNGSCYSTMQVLADGTLAILFEDESYSADNGYAINYVTITKEQVLSWYENLTDEVYNPNVKNSVQGSSTGCDSYGSFTNGSSNWYTTWTSNDTSGKAGVTVVASGNDLGYATGYSQRVMSMRPSAAGATDNITITAPAGYYIDSYTIGGKNWSSSQSYKLIAPDGTEVTTGTSTVNSITVENVNSTTSTFQFYGSSTTNFLCITNFIIKLRSKYPVALNVVGDASYATLYVPFDLAIPSNTSAYYVEQVENGEAYLTEVLDGNIPAGTAVVIKNTNALTEATFSVTSGLTSVIDESANLLKGTYTAIDLNLSDNTSYYSLGRLNGEIGFYKYTGGTITLGANKAYLDTTVPSSSSSSKGFTLNFGDVTSIEQIEGATKNTNVQGDNIFYNLSGQRVSHPTKGLYIVNGKKVVIK